MGALENKELVQTIRELVLEGYTPLEIMEVAIEVDDQLARLITGGNK